MKDNFSKISAQYSRFRPGYPEEIFQFIKSEIQCFDLAWDCGTGNGQVALPLSDMFKKVYATDISAKQLQNAYVRPNIIYSQQPAEKTIFGTGIFDLISVAQAIHWFNFNKFYEEVNRTLKLDGTIVILGYGLLKTNPETQKLIHDLYHNVLGLFWDPERKYIEENYNTIPFPFREITVPFFSTTFQWNFQQLVGYLRTWSAVQHFLKTEEYDPLEQFIPQLKKAFGSSGEVTFPILLRVGKKL